MLEAPGTIASPLSLILDIADKLLKLAAVALGGVWTYWNYRKSRVYAQKLELALAGDVFGDQHRYVELTVTIKNLGLSRHLVQQRGSSCEVVAVNSDLTEESLRLFEVFALHEHIEPGETIGDQIAWSLPSTQKEIVWLKINLRVVSGSVE